MKILFINTNRYRFPPVVPLGIEYLAGELSKTRHRYEACDLCFSSDVDNDIEEAIRRFRPDAVGITIRQIDTVLFQNNEYYLPDIKKIVSRCGKCGCTTILGGSGFSIMPEEILAYTSADFGISGPGEPALVDLLNRLECNEPSPRVIDGYDYFPDSEYRFERKLLFDYGLYAQTGGIAGFRTQVGCDGTCLFCTEAGKRNIFHPPDLVGKEIAMLKEKGIEQFHLCDSEFNLELDRAVSVCKSLIASCGPVNWTLYMKPDPVSEELFFYLQQSGARLITLSLNSIDNNFGSVEEFCNRASHYRIKIAVDLSTGFPNEHPDSLERCIEFLDAMEVSTVGVNSFYRIYPGTGLHDLIKKDASMRRFLVNGAPDDTFLEPVFYNFFPEDCIRKAIGNRKKFRVEGFEKATNYQRV
ncbi:MAG: cobalamin-dependent protein [Chitinispirillaceae bacterium]|nr:cobalamin-dependent protein [Chitinispirillaceae bacterium]